MVNVVAQVSVVAKGTLARECYCDLQDDDDEWIPPLHVDVENSVSGKTCTMTYSCSWCGKPFKKILFEEKEESNEQTVLNFSEVT